MSLSRGKFIVLEGIDGCGKGTQVKKLAAHLKGQKTQVKTLSYPDSEGPIGELIYKWLNRKYDFSKEVQSLLYFSDFLKDKEKINKWLKEGKTIISDRYFSSTIVYQCLGGFPLKKSLHVSKLFDLPKPDLIIYIDISSDTSIKRKFGQKGELDRHEADAKFQSDLAKSYKKLIKKQTFAKWVAIDGEKSADKVFTEIKKLI